MTEEAAVLEQVMQRARDLVAHRDGGGRIVCWCGERIAVRWDFPRARIELWHSLGSLYPIAYVPEDILGQRSLIAAIRDHLDAVHERDRIWDTH